MSNTQKAISHQKMLITAVNQINDIILDNADDVSAEEIITTVCQFWQISNTDSKKSIKPSGKDLKKLFLEARQQKAKRLGVSLSEVNLTKEEKDRVKKGSQVIQRNYPLKDNSFVVINPISKTSSELKEEKKVEVVEASLLQKKSTKIVVESLASRKVTIRSHHKAAKAAFTSACYGQNIHMVAYYNRYLTLQRCWLKFIEDFPTDFERSQNPLENLVLPDWLVDYIKYIASQAKLTEEEDHKGDLVLYKLQDSNGQSYWNNGECAANAPDILSSESIEFKQRLLRGLGLVQTDAIIAKSV